MILVGKVFKKEGFIKKFLLKQSAILVPGNNQDDIGSTILFYRSSTNAVPVKVQ
jgi:hypothetical protein